MKGKYKRTKIWCSKCDANHVAPGTICDNCNHRELGAKIKKPTWGEIRNMFYKLID